MFAIQNIKTGKFLYGTDYRYRPPHQRTSNTKKLCNEYRENKRLIEELEAMNDNIKTDILAIMGDRETVTEGASKATYKAVTSSRFDSSGFRKVYPDLFTEYSTPTTYRRFTVQ